MNIASNISSCYHYFLLNSRTMIYFRSILRALLLTVVMMILLAGCGQLDIAAGPLVYNVVLTPNSITPNADGNQDVTEIKYSLRRSAAVSIYFENAAKERFYFRQDRRRSPGDYSVFWGGTVEVTTTKQTDYGP